MFASLFGGIYGSYLKIKESTAWKRFKRSSTMARLREKKSQRLADELMSLNIHL